MGMVGRGWYVQEIIFRLEGFPHCVSSDFEGCDAAGWEGYVGVVEEVGEVGCEEEVGC